MLVNGVFEGGGVKGIALAGAVHAAESRGVRFNRLAGTSSGSIIAALIAAGYTGEETKQIVEQTPFRSFLKRSWIYDPKFIGPTLRLFIKKGLYSGEALENWIYQLLLKKGIRTFGDLEPNRLRIIASDISRGKLLVLPDDIANYGIDPAKMLVSKAVRMSTSIPYFFDPVILRDMAPSKQKVLRFEYVYIVDGGLLSNFPLWVFDHEGESAGVPIPTIGFQLVGKQTGMPNQISGPISMLKALVATMLDAHDERYIEDHNRFRTIKIPTLGVHTTDFDLTTKQSEQLYASGFQAAEAFFGKWKISDYQMKYEKHILRKNK